MSNSTAAISREDYDGDFAGAGAPMAGAAADSPINLDFTDEHEGRHRAEAVREHVKRTRGHLLNMLTMIVMVAAAPVFWRVVFTGAGLTFAEVWPIASIEAWASGMLAMLSAVPFVVTFTLLAAITLFPPLWSVGHLMLYRRERDRDWRVAEAQAGERDPTAGARGYMNVFRLYARTKRRGIFTLLFGAAGIWWSAVGIVCFLLGSVAAPAGAVALAHGATAVLAFVAWVFVIYFGYDVGRRYVPGKVLVTKTLILSVLATTSQTNYTDAREAARELEADIVEEKPWWFYSYKKKPRRYV
ncbi:MAG: hypothetical protein KDA46_11285 [Parvularculaceae bacterium]|nr:hypothetical protein [Parvularculaceae bacterium]